MRIHTDTLTYSDIYRATNAAEMVGVSVSITAHGSRSRATAFDVTLTGTSSRRPNPGTGGRYPSDDHAATWDEWGMFLAALFNADPNAFAGSAAHPVYANRDHFHAVTGDRFRTLTAPYQHGAGGHRWDYTNGNLTCACGASRPRLVG